MILDEEVLELAKSYKFDNFVGEKDDETDGVYWECWEDQLIEFAKKIYEMGYDDGCYETSHFTGHTGLFGEPQ